MANQKHMKVLCLLLIAALGISLVPSAVFAEEPVVNLAKNATVLDVSSNPPTASEAPTFAFDGDEHLTKWCTINSPGWVVFDIGAAANISELKVFHAGEGTNETIPNNTKAFELQILDETKCTEQAFSEISDKTTIMTTDGYWKSVCTVENNSNSITHHGFTGCTARFFRFHVSDAGEDKCIRIYEIELFGESTGEPPRPEYTVTVENGKATVLTWNDNHFNVGEWGQTIKAEQGYEVALKLNEDYAVPAGKALIGFDVTAGTKQLNTAETWVGGSDYYISFTMPDKDVTVKPIFGAAIDTIYIRVHVPVAGEHPNDIVTPAKPDSHYAVFKVKWFVCDDQGNAERMDSDAVFEVGKEYKVQFTVTPDDGYSLNIDDGEDGRIFINNKDISEFPEYGCRHGDVRLFFPPVKPGDHTLRYKTASAYGQFPKEYNDNYWEEKHIPDGPYTLKTDKELGLTCIDDEYLFLGWTEKKITCINLKTTLRLI